MPWLNIIIYGHVARRIIQKYIEMWKSFPILEQCKTNNIIDLKQQERVGAGRLFVTLTKQSRNNLACFGCLFNQMELRSF